MSEFFFEIRSGEIPATQQSYALKEMQTRVAKELEKLQLPYGEIKTYVTPNRLVAVVNGIPSIKPSQIVEKKGPDINAVTQAIKGFAKSVNKSIEQLEQKTTNKGTFFFDVKILPEQKTIELLPHLIQQVICNFKWSKSMYWSTTKYSWIRPIYGGCSIFNGMPVNFDWNISHDEYLSSDDRVVIKFDDTTVGHSILSPKNFKVCSFDEYQAKLRDHFVIVNQQERKDLIEKQIAQICTQHNVQLKCDKKLLDEVTGLVEYPNCLCGKIKKDFLHIPIEILSTVMRVHQRYFTVVDKNNNIAPLFIFVANIQGKDNNHQIISGNEKVLQARFEDALFFYKQDKQETIEKRQNKLTNVLFHQKLGTIADKQIRISKIINILCSDKNKNNIAISASKVCKTDLASHIVFEFHELQGIMGKYYNVGNNEMLLAIAQQYLPQGPSEDIPESFSGKLLSLADRFDNLIGCFLINLKPTGSKDPFALRRAALGIIRILESAKLIIPSDTIQQIIKIYSEQFNKQFKDISPDILNFIDDRLSIYLEEQGILLAYVKSVSHISPLHVPLRCQNILLAQNLITHMPQLTSAYAKINNIVQQHSEIEKKSILSINGSSEIEKQIIEAINNHNNKSKNNQNINLQEIVILNDVEEYYKTFFTSLLLLINNFFNNTYINDSTKNILIDRINLLRALGLLFKNIANFAILHKNV